MFDLLDASKSFGGREVLSGFNLHVEPETTTVLIGPSGCGKSTVLRLMTGLLRPDTGQVMFRNEPLTTANLLQARRSMGYVIQEGGLFAHLTAGRNVTLMARYLGQQPDKIQKRLGELVELVRLHGELLARYPTELSGGQRQRVSLIRALMLDPDVLLLDEPLGALDPMVRFDLQTDLKQIFQTLKKTVVLVTHDIVEAAYFGNEIVLMRDGRIVQKGTMKDLVERPSEEFVGRFLAAQRVGVGNSNDPSRASGRANQ
ncbi:MAG TPA: ATP-binding cassette domain-containing protein [Tepidisphaeraceae bacterium]|jgi:osmoprotectant transport system ATP-binding protein